MKNLALFDEPLAEIVPAADRPDPVAWIRRLAIVDELAPTGRTIREVEFRRGLNIVRTVERPDDELRTVGHSVGKTLLLRLIRYCLGEPAFCTKAVREAVANKLPTGFVLAEIVLHGEPWVVARPIGMDSSAASSKASQGSDWNVLREGTPQTIRFSDFVEHVEAATIHTVEGEAAHAGRRARWRDLLAWLARDQNCRYRHHYEWRDSESESGTASLKVEDASLVIRAVMELLDDEEVALRQKHKQLHEEDSRLERQIHRIQAFLEVTQQELKLVLGLDDDMPVGEVFTELTIKRARERRESLHRLMHEQQASVDLDTLDQRRITAIKALAIAQTEIRGLRAKHDADSAILAQEEGSAEHNLFGSYAQQAGWCRSFSTREEARAAGCQYEPPPRRPGERDAEQQRRIDEIRRHVAELSNEIHERQSRLPELELESSEADQDYRRKRDLLSERVGKLRQRIGKYDDIVLRARHFGIHLAQLRQLEAAKQANQTAIEASLDEQRDARVRLDRRRTDLARYFDWTLKKLLGPDAGGSIEIDAKGIHPRPIRDLAPSGAAMATSSTVLGFDLACLIASISGLGQFPRLLLHDSPREADMERPMYYRLFHLLAELERLFADREPSFQYIVTTTTPPPAEFANEPFVRLTLDARNDDGLLFRTRF
jgi:hypothetical protein